MTSRAQAVLTAHVEGGRAGLGVRVAVTPDRMLLSVVDAGPVFAAHGGKGKARHAERAVVVWGPTPSDEQRRAVDAFVARHAIGHAPVPSSCGRPAAVAVEEGFVGSDDLVLGTRAEIGALGGLGALFLRCAPLELAALLDEPTLEIVVPASVPVIVEGRLPRWVGGFDLAARILEHLGGVSAVRGRVLELGGSTIAELSVPERMVLCEIIAHAGLAALVPPDEATRVWLAARRARPAPAAQRPKGGGGQPVGAGGEAVQSLDARRVAPAALRLPWSGEILAPPADVGRVERVVIVGTLDELRVATGALSERRVDARVQLLVQPTTRRTLQHAIDEGLVGALVRAGGSLLPPGADVEGTAASLATRPLGGGELLAGPAVAAASAAAGRLMDPESMRRSHKRASGLH